MPKQPLFLSKSKFIHGLHCLKLLWYEYNRKKEIPPPSIDVQEIMKQGAIVGELAQQLWPDGIRVERDWNPKLMHQKSLAELKKGRSLFEGGFTYKNAYAIADILVPVGDGSWDLIEVKSTASVKDDHYYDVAFQKYVYEGAGIKIRRCYLMYINRDYVRRGKLALAQLFKREDISVEVMERLPGIEPKIAQMLEVITGKEPQIKVGSQCRNCILGQRCWDFLPADNVFVLRGNKTVSYGLMEQGILKIEDIPEDYELNEKQAIQLKAHKSGKAYIDKKEIKSFIDGLNYPLYFLDFETIAPAVPIYDNTRPYEDIPVQFSLHIVEQKGAAPKHYGYLAPGDRDPRPEVLKHLKRLLGSTGSIVAYFAEFEKKCIRHAVKAYPENTEWFVKLKDRFADLFVPFKNLHYYDPAQQGGASMKDVLPALTGVSYDKMEIANGAAATFEYLRVTYNEQVDETEKNRVRKALEKYCELDTLGMVKILRVLEEAVS